MIWIKQWIIQEWSILVCLDKSRVLVLSIQGRSDKKQCRLEKLKLKVQNRGDSRTLTVWKIESTTTEVHHFVLLILNGFDTVRMFTVISVMSETNVCETAMNMNAHPVYHSLTDL